MSDCSICRGDEPEIAGTPLTKVFFARDRKLDAHLVVACREHRVWLDELRPDEAADLFVVAQKIATSLTGQHGIDKFYLAAVGDVDRHFHLHLLPRSAGEAGLGPFIFGDDGWVGRTSAPLQPEAGINEMVKAALQR